MLRVSPPSHVYTYLLTYIIPVCVCIYIYINLYIRVCICSLVYACVDAASFASSNLVYIVLTNRRFSQKHRYIGVSENRGPEYSTLNSRILIIGTSKQGTPSFRKLLCRQQAKTQVAMQRRLSHQKSPRLGTLDPKP